MQASRARRRFLIVSLFALVGTAALSVAAVASAPSPSKAGAKPQAAAGAKPQAASDQSKTASDPAEAKVDLKLIASGATQKLGGYIPQQVKLTEKKPASVKKAPDLKAPLYGEIKFAGKSYLLALDEPKEGDAKLYVDANANGDLSDDPEATWASDSYTAQDGTALT
jgi:hypothetical protein